MIKKPKFIFESKPIHIIYSSNQKVELLFGIKVLNYKDKKSKHFRQTKPVNIYTTNLY